MAIISNGVTVISNGAGSAPTNAQILSGVASGSGNTVGTYGWLVLRNNGTTINSGNEFYPNNTVSGSYLYYCNGQGTQTSQQKPSGTWRVMGRAEDANDSAQACMTLWLRIS